MRSLLSGFVLMLGADLAGAGTPPPPTIGTMSHAVVKGVAHAFTSEEVKAKVGAAVIIANTSNPLEGYEKKLLHVEYYPLFVNPRRAGKSITQAQLKDVLEGKIKDWRDLGQAEGRIQLYLHGAALQRKAFESMIKSKLNADPAKLQGAEPRRFDNYEELRRAAAKDPNGITIGLNTWKPADLQVLPVEGISLEDPKAKGKYLLRVPVYMYIQGTMKVKDAKVVEVIDLFQRTLKENMQSMGSPYKKN